MGRQEEWGGRGIRRSRLCSAGTPTQGSIPGPQYHIRAKGSLLTRGATQAPLRYSVYCRKPVVMQMIAKDSQPLCEDAIDFCPLEETKFASISKFISTFLIIFM